MGNQIAELLKFIYGPEEGERTAGELAALAEKRRPELKPPTWAKDEGFQLDESDAFLITYGDQFQGDEGCPLEYLVRFSDEFLGGIVSGVHILPFFPYTSDDGFSVSDYRAVDPLLGDWSHVSTLGKRFKLMGDLVLNHSSVSHSWFKAFIADGLDYYITASPDDDLSRVARPRTHPLLTPFESPRGTLHVWTTFSADQADLKFANPRVLLEMADIFLYYVSQGIQVVRLDAIAYLWKETGKADAGGEDPGYKSGSCLHHPKTHAVVKLFRAMIEEWAPWVVLLTETNVPHKDNLSYLGNRDDEAHMVYQFALPPLVLDAFLREDGEHLKNWAAELPLPDGKTTYFNFLASHDGIGVLPAQGILSPEEMQNLLDSVLARGGRISYKDTPAGPIPYELNINYFSAVCGETVPGDITRGVSEVVSGGAAGEAPGKAPGEASGTGGTPEGGEEEIPEKFLRRKFLATQAIILSLPGVPGIYVHSFLGSENWAQGPEITGANRSINREKFDYLAIRDELKDPAGRRYRIREAYVRMLHIRRTRKAFHPFGELKVLPSPREILAYVRIAPDGSDKILCLINVSGKELIYDGGGQTIPEESRNLLSGRELVFKRQGELVVEPWEVLWFPVD